MSVIDRLKSSVTSGVKSAISGTPLGGAANAIIQGGKIGLGAVNALRNPASTNTVARAQQTGIIGSSGMSSSGLPTGPQSVGTTNTRPAPNMSGGQSTVGQQPNQSSVINSLKAPTAVKPPAPVVEKAPPVPTIPPITSGTRDPRVQAMLDQTIAKSSQATGPTIETAMTERPLQNNTVNQTTPVKPTAAVDPYASYRSTIDKLRSGVVGLSAPGTEERALQDELARFRGDARMGISGLEGQGRGIPLSLIQGQQAQLTEQAGIQEQTLLDRLSAASAQRQADLAAQQLQLGYANQDFQTEQALQGELKPFELGGSLVKLNPATGQYESVYSAPASAGEGFTLTPGQQRFDASGNLIAGVDAAPDKPSAAPATVQEYQFAQSQGFNGSFLDYQRAKEAATAQSKPLSAEAQKFKNIIASGDQALKTIEDYVKKYPNAIGSLNLAQRQIYDAARTSLTDVIGRLRSGGAINGDEEARFLKMLPSPTDFDESAMYKISQLRTALGQTGASLDTGDGQDDPLGLGFSQDLSTSGNGSAAQIAAAIKQVESGGNYNASGGSGEFGAYQFMPDTWKGWAQQFLGDPNAPMTPQNQDKVAHAKIQSLLDQGYTPEQVALTWNAGSPVRRAGTNKFGVKYDSGAYADKVLAEYNRYA